MDQWTHHSKAARREEQARAEAGEEVLAEYIRPVPPHTKQCSGLEFKQQKALAKSGRPRSPLCLPVLSPVCNLAIVWYGIANLTDMTYTSFIVALSLAFNDQAHPKLSWLTICDLIGSCVYVIDMYMGFHIGFIARWDNRAVIVRDWRATAVFYLRGNFTIDAIALSSTIVQVVATVLQLEGHRIRMVYILKLLRLVRVIRLLRDIQPGRGRGGVFEPVFFLLTSRTLLLLNAFFSLAVLVNLLGCLWWNIAINEGIDNSWASPDLLGKDYDLQYASDAQRWVVCCYFAMTTLATIGYGDITPVTITETGVVLIFELVGVAFFGYILNTVTAILAATGPEAKRLEAVKEKMQEVESLLAHGQGLSKTLKGSIRMYYREHWRPASAVDPRFQLYSELPPHLRLRFIQQRQAAALAALSFFPPSLTYKQHKEAQRILAAATLPVHLQVGQQLEEAVADAAEAEPTTAGGQAVDLTAPCFFILEEGEMRALRPGDSTLVQRHAISGRVDFSGPAVVGLSSLFSPLTVQSAVSTDAAADAPVPGQPPASSAAGQPPPAAAAARPAVTEELGASWKQRALALTDCHLWRIDARQMFAELHAKQPAALVYLLRRLLASLEAQQAGPGGGGGPPANGLPAEAAAGAAPPAPAPWGSPPRMPEPRVLVQARPSQRLSVRQAIIKHLHEVLEELEAEAKAAAKQESGRPEAGRTPSAVAAMWKLSAATGESSLIDAIAEGDDEADVERGGNSEGADEPADVWHVD